MKGVRGRARARRSRTPDELDAPGGGRTSRVRWIRRGVTVVLLIGYAALLWYLVFPWVDRTFVNRPAV